MYGKARITITNSNEIVLSGNKTWNPVGRFYMVDGSFVGRLRNKDSYSTSLNENNSVEFKLSNKSEIRNFVKSVYENL